MKLLLKVLLVALVFPGCSAPLLLREPKPVVLADGTGIWVVRRIPTLTPAPSLQKKQHVPAVYRDAVVIERCEALDPPVCKVALIQGEWEDSAWPYMKGQ